MTPLWATSQQPHKKNDQMQKLYFITVEGVCGYSAEWECKNAPYDAAGWLEKFGDRIGSGTAPLPNGLGFIDLSRFATVTTWDLARTTLAELKGNPKC